MLSRVGAEAPFVLASVSALLVEFLTDALVATPGEVAAAVAARLGSLPTAGDGRVLDLERKFPEHAQDDRPEIVLLGEWSAATYGARIAERVARAAACEGRSWDLAALNRAWGIMDAG